MVCNSLEQLRAIVRATTARMAAEGYSAIRHDDDSYLVTRPNGNAHRVFVTDPCSCDCRFFTENSPVYGSNTLCKHLMYASEQAAWDEWADRFAPPIDADDYGDGHQVPGLAE